MSRESQSHTATINVVRSPGPIDVCRKYTIVIDDKNVGTLDPNGGVSVDVLPGEHSVYARFSFVRSPRLVVNIAAGDTACVTCRARNYSPLRAYFGRNKYIDITLSPSRLSPQRTMQNETRLRLVVLVANAAICVVVLLPILLTAGVSNEVTSIVIGVLVGLTSLWCSLGPSPPPRIRDRPRRTSV
jgi:hypothetical protein